MNKHQLKRLDDVLPKLADIAIEFENIGLMYAAHLTRELETKLYNMDGVEIIHGPKI